MAILWVVFCVLLNAQELKAHGASVRIEVQLPGFGRPMVAEEAGKGEIVRIFFSGYAERRQTWVLGK